MSFAIPQGQEVDRHINGFPRVPTESDGRRHDARSAEPFENVQDRVDAIRRIATTVTSQSLQQDPFQVASGGTLDPLSPHFDAAAWTKAFYSIHSDHSTIKSWQRGLAFRHLSVSGYGSPTDFQKTVGNVFLDAVTIVSRLLGRKNRKVQILHDFEGVINSGELLCVLGPPGSGCSTLLKSIAGETHGLHTEKGSYLNYKGVSYEEMTTRFQGEATYTAEDDSHMPMLSVGDTLQFAALARSPRILSGGISRKVYAQKLAAVVMATFGISHTRDTRVGDDVRQGQTNQNID